jgi:hypothetical protein
VKYAGFTGLLLALAGLASAQDAPPDAADRLRQLQRDFALIEVLVQEGLHLAGQDDPLQRAESCNVVAKRLVQEIKQAAGERDQPRATQLGNYLHSVLVRGVAGNLDTARSRLDDDSGPNPDFQRIRDEALRVTEPVTGEHAQGSERQLMEPAAEAINKGRTAVQDAAKRKKKP